MQFVIILQCILLGVSWFWLFDLHEKMSILYERVRVTEHYISEHEGRLYGLAKLLEKMECGE